MALQLIVSYPTLDMKVTMSFCGFDQWFNHITKLDESSKITSEELRLRLNDNKTSDYVSSVISPFARYGTIHDIDALLAHYENGTRNIHGFTVSNALMRAICDEGRQDLLEHMVSLGFTPCSTCLDNAVFKKNNSMIDYLLSIKCEIWRHALGRVNDLTIATKLILYGAEVNPKNSFLSSPLQRLIMSNKIDIALLLISMNAEVNETIVNLALKNGDPQLIEAVQSRV